MEIISDQRDLEALQPAWDGLMEEAAMSHPFVSHEWVTTWWECFGAGKQLHLVLIKSGEKIRGIIPLMLSRERWHGLPVRRLGTLYNTHTSRYDFIVARNSIPGVYRALWQHLAGIRKSWDVLELCRFTENSTALSVLAESAADEGFPAGYWASETSPYLPVAGRWEDYFRTLGKNHRSSIRRRSRRLAELGNTRMETLRSGDGVDEALTDGFRIEAMAWKGEAGTAILANEAMQKFYRSLAARSVNQGRLRLYFLTVNGRRIAFQYSLVFRNKIYLMKPGYDVEYAHYSPSTLLTWMILKDAFEAGISECDFLGADTPWKLEWTRELRAHRWLFIFPGTGYGKFLHAVKFRLIPNIKRLIAAAQKSRV